MPRVNASLDPQFAVLDLPAIQDAALSTASRLRASYACVRVHQIKTRMLHVRDLRLDTAVDHRDIGAGVRVIVDGA